MAETKVVQLTLSVVVPVAMKPAVVARDIARVLNENKGGREWGDWKVGRAQVVAPAPDKTPDTAEVGKVIADTLSVALDTVKRMKGLG